MPEPVATVCMSGGAASLFQNFVTCDSALFNAADVMKPSMSGISFTSGPRLAQASARRAGTQKFAVHIASGHVDDMQIVAVFIME